MTNPDGSIATLGGGCFWCLDAAYAQVDGISAIVSGYAGGSVDNPTYEEVCSGRTGHAEVVQMTFDPERVSYRDLLEIFFTIHDPTTLNRQGADVGTQYRSVIFYHDEEQRRIAGEVISAMTAEGYWPNPVVTEVLPSPIFYPAEGHHQDYYARNSGQPYCQVVIEPKLAKLRKMHYDRLRGSRSESSLPSDDEAQPSQTQPPNPLDRGGMMD